jgi:hypothetical protein
MRYLIKKIKVVIAPFLAFVLAPVQLVHSMENKETHFDSLPRPVKALIFEHASSNTKPGDIRLVCKDWQKTMDGKEIELTQEGTQYADIGPIWKKCVHAWYGAKGHEENLKQFLNGKLIYKLKSANEEGKIELKISNLKNPFAGTFELSMCENVGTYIAVMTGIRKGKVQENADKVEIWITPRFLIEKFLESSAKHFEPLMNGWDESTAPLGLFYNWGDWSDLSWYEYLTNKSPTDISSRNLHENWRNTTVHHNDGFIMIYDIDDKIHLHFNS